MQIYKMNKYNIGMSATNAYQGKGIYNKDHSYERYINCRHIYNHYDSKTQIIKHLMGFDIICSKNLIKHIFIHSIQLLSGGNIRFFIIKQIKPSNT